MEFLTIRSKSLRELTAAALLVGGYCVQQPALGQFYYPSIPTEQWYNWTDDGVRHYVIEFGDLDSLSDPIVVIHGGWGSEHSYLIEPLLSLAGRYRFVLYDQRGSLRSPAPASSISIDRLVADLEDLRVALGVERLTIASHSMGNALAYAYLAIHPHHVRGLVLLSPVHPTLYLGPPNMDFIHAVWEDADSASLNGTYNAFMADSARRGRELVDAEGLLPDNLRDTAPDELDVFNIGEDRDRTRAWRIFFAAANSCTGENWERMRGGQVFYDESVANAIVRQDYNRYERMTEMFWPALRDFPGPVRVIMGTCDYVDIGPSVWPRLIEQLPDAELAIIDATGHMPWMDEPELFAGALSNALRSLVEDENY